MGCRQFVPTSWGGYFIRHADLEAARRLGERWAEETLVKMRRAIARGTR